MNNSINKVNEIQNNNSPHIRGKKYCILENIPKMVFVDTKVVDSTANVVNKVESQNVDLETMPMQLIISIIIMSASVFLKVYKLHNRCLKKRFQSQANDLDKIKKTRKEVNLGKPKFVYPCSYNY